MAGDKVFRWNLKSIVFMVIATHALAQKIPSIIKKSDCNYNVDRNQQVGIIQHKRSKRCEYAVMELSQLSKEIMVFETVAMACNGRNTSVKFPTLSNGTRKWNFCTRTQCLAYTRRRFTFQQADVLATIGDAFPKCKNYTISKKPVALKFGVSKGTRSFRLRYKLFDRISPATKRTTSTTRSTTITSAKLATTTTASTITKTASTKESTIAQSGLTQAVTTMKVSIHNSRESITTSGTGKRGETSNPALEIAHNKMNATTTEAGNNLMLTSATQEEQVETTTAGELKTTSNPTATTSKHAEHVTTTAAGPTAGANADATHQGTKEATAASQQGVTKATAQDLSTTSPHKLGILTSAMAADTLPQRLNATNVNSAADMVTKESNNFTTSSDQLNNAGSKNTPKSTTGSKSWHYILPITLGLLLIIGLVIFIVCKKKKTSGKGTTRASFTARRL